jgi:hypothetical protein
MGKCIIDGVLVQIKPKKGKHGQQGEDFEPVLDVSFERNRVKFSV